MGFRCGSSRVKKQTKITIFLNFQLKKHEKNNDFFRFWGLTFGHFRSISYQFLSFQGHNLTPLTISRLHVQALAFSYLLGVGCMPKGAGCGSELRRASRAGAQNGIRDTGALRAPAPTIFFDFCNDFFESRVSFFLSLSCSFGRFQGLTFLV